MVRSKTSVVGRCVCVALLVLASLFALISEMRADLGSPRAEDRLITRRVAQLITREHLSEHAMDDEMSRRCLKAFIEKLDLWKVYFYQSDINKFAKYETLLDDLIREGDTNFANMVFNTFLERVDQRVASIVDILATEHDFTVDEQILSDRDLARFPKTEAEANERWRKRIKYDLLLLKVDDIEGQEALDKLARRYSSFSKRMHQVDQEDLLEMYLSSMTSGFDPHSSYMSPGTLKNFEIIMGLHLEGVGAELKVDDGYTIVNKIVRGGAADKDGRLKVEDKIVGVRTTPESELVDIVDMKLTDVVQLIRGPKETIVILEVVPADGGKRKMIDITRARIELTDKQAQGEVFEEGHKADGTHYKIGVIDLPSFYMDMEAARDGDPNYKSTTRDVRKILERFNAEKVDALVLDLRYNGGGSLIEAINCTGLFIDTGPIVQVKDNNDQVRVYEDEDEGAVWSRPMIVLTSQFSASASEILAGAIQDYRRGLIVGDPATHGKGTVQNLTELGRGLFGVPNSVKLGALKLTIQQFYRPGGASTQNRGVEADIELPSLTAHYDVGEADLDYSMKFDEVERASFQTLDRTSKAISERLSQLSAKRREESEDFQKVARNIVRYKQQKAKKYITLNEEKFLEERAELNADKQQEKAMEDIRDNDGTKIERNYYLDEALAIAVDYINLREVARAH